MSDGAKVLDLEAIEALFASIRERPWTDADGRRARESIAEDALVAEVKRLRTALAGLVKINAEDFPAGPDGKIDWSAFPVTFGYANAYRAALEVLGALPLSEPQRREGSPGERCRNCGGPTELVALCMPCNVGDP